MRIKHHLSKSLELQPAPTPIPRMILSGLSVCLPLVLGYMRGDLQVAIYGSLFGFNLILNDHFGPLGRRVLHLITTTIFIMTGFMVGLLLSDSHTLLLIVLFCMSYLLGKAKGLGYELERMLLFTTIHMVNASQSAALGGVFIKLFFYASLSLLNYLVCLCLVYLVLKHPFNFQKSKREEFREAFKTKNNNRYALTMSFVACAGLVISEYLSIDRAAWFVGTILIVMVPDHYQSFYRSFQRALGTCLGVFIAAFLMKFTHHPMLLISFCTFFAFLAPLGLIRNYWLGNTFIAALILFFLEISAPVTHMGDWDLAMVRIADIGLGCLFGAIGTLIAFPQIFRSNKV